MQGPPGTGKTYTAAEQILELIAHGRTVGITGPSHAVIGHLIDTVYEHARWRGAGMPRVGQRADRDNPHRHPDAAIMSNEQLEKAWRDGELDVAADTAWLWARAGMAASVDTLFVAQAGQISLANVVAVAGAARNLVLLGDPQQLAQPSHATHPPGAGASALEHILGDRATMPAPPGCCSTRPGGCTRTCAGTPRRRSTTASCTGSTGWAARRSWAGPRACASSRCRTRATPTPRRKRPARWPGWRSS